MSPGCAEYAAPLGALRAQAMFGRLAQIVAPAGAAGAVTASHSARPASGILVFATMALTGAALRSGHYPLQLMRVARRALDFGAPSLALALAVAWSAAHGARLEPHGVAAALVAAWTMALLSARLVDCFAVARPVRFAVLGPAWQADAVADEIANAGVRGYRLVGYVSPRAHLACDSTHCAAALGPLSCLREIVREHGIDVLVLRSDESRLAALEAVTESCLDLRVRLLEASMFHEELLGRVPIAAINAAWFEYMMHPRFNASAPPSKRLVDLVVAGVALVLVAPVLAALAVAIKLADGGPALYRQRRVGERGSEFAVLKLRTMHVDAEADGRAVWATDSDVRVTALGRLLRRTHLDELPQLINVLKGEMSLVGPRPERPALIDELERRLPFYQRRHLVKPGLTGWAQVRCGYCGSLSGSAQKLCHDLYYLKRRSVLLDLLILVETMRVLVADARVLQALPPDEPLLGREVADALGPH